MTPQEIQLAIEGMLNIQRGLQESQLKLHEGQLNHESRLGRLEENFQTMVQVQSETLAIVREMQAEVRGLQTENRRILDRVFGEENSN